MKGGSQTAHGIDPRGLLNFSMSTGTGLEPPQIPHRLESEITAKELSNLGSCVVFQEPSKNVS